MEFNASIRKEIKAEQKDRVLANKGRFFLVLVLCALPGMLLQMLAHELGGDVNVILDYVMSASASSALAQALLANYIKWSLIFTIISLVVLAPITFGQMSFMINASRGDIEGATSVFKPFSSGKEIWRSIRMQFCLMLRSLLWMIVPIIAFSVGFVSIMMGSMDIYGGIAESAVVPMILLFIAYIIAILFIAVKIEMYTGGYVFMRDDEDVGVWEATRRAAIVFKGHYMDLFKFELSFLPWILAPIAFMLFAVLLLGVSEGLSLLLALVGFIALIPLALFVGVYRSTSYFAMFDYLANGGARENTLGEGLM